MIKINDKLLTECYYVILENFKSFHKSRSSQTWQMKNIPKTRISFNFYHLSSSRVLDRKANTKINIKTTHPIALTSFSNFLSFNSRVFIFFVFCISTEQYLVWHLLIIKSRNVELFCKIIIQLSSTGIFLGL